MTVRTLDPGIAPYLDAARGRALPGAGLAWLDQARGRALERFAQHGIPNQRLERWKFTGPNALSRTPFVTQPAAATITAADVTRLAHDVSVGHRLVFVDGVYRPDLSDLGHLPGNVRLTDFATALADGGDALEPWLDVDISDRADSLAAYGLGCADHGAVLHLGAGATLDPIHLIFVHGTGEEVATHARTLILVEAGASASVLESHVGLGDGRYWANSVNRIVIGENAVLRHALLQAEAPRAIRTSATRVDLGAQAGYHGFTLSIGAELAREEVAVHQTGRQTDCRLAAASLAHNRQHLDTTWRINHALPDGQSNQLFKSIADDQGHVVFQGAVNVAPHAIKTDAQQLCRHLLLSDRAQADTKPELEILADDVKCSHGAAIGDLDADAMFYLAQRGVPADTARAMLIGAHLAEPIARLESDQLRRFFFRELAARLGVAVEDLA